MSAPDRGNRRAARAARRQSSTDTRFGLPAATALVVGSIIGIGVFALPS
ncbi:hypothetical protein [Kitasatospora purpeofusca]|nr:hypothetical protein [Kitasatospora purpeofusca]MCX4755706.1 hypothetical protein [Kitasatospora purpeofusca]WSR36432.1 hypothetical protein OG715_39060 [Kitasatospora purpeofusca]WSR44718.1 hypothetical protein OG196_39950 [Kitasatospora purpeofusca]